MPKKVLVAYASKSGSTAGIAEAIGAELRTHHHEADVVDVAAVKDIEPYDAVVLGSAIYIRRWRRDAVRFLKHNADALRGRQVWLFHSGPVGPDKDQDQVMPPTVRRLAHEIGASPAITFPGRLDPASAHGFLTRRLATGNLAGDFRDWNRIRIWAADISAALDASERSSWHRTPVRNKTKPPGGYFLG